MLTMDTYDEHDAQMVETFFESSEMAESAFAALQVARGNWEAAQSLFAEENSETWDAFGLWLSERGTPDPDLRTNFDTNYDYPHADDW